jgi:hypothetical protein
VLLDKPVRELRAREYHPITLLLKQYKFSPAMYQGHAVSVRVMVDFAYTVAGIARAKYYPITAASWCPQVVWTAQIVRNIRALFSHIADCDPARRLRRGLCDSLGD